MNEIQKHVLGLIESLQKSCPEYSPARMVGEQLKGIALAETESAELLDQDLQKKGMGLADAEKLIRARADEIHKTVKGNCVAVPPWEAEDILRKFYGLRERSRGPGKEPEDRDTTSSGPSGSLPLKGKASQGEGKGKLLDLADFL